MASGILADLNGNVISCGAGAERIFGYTEAEVLGKSVAVFHPERTRSMLPRLVAEALAGRFREEVVLVRKNGEEFRALLEVTPVRNAKGEVTGLMGLTKEL